MVFFARIYGTQLFLSTVNDYLNPLPLSKFPIPRLGRKVNKPELSLSLREKLLFTSTDSFFFFSDELEPWNLVKSNCKRIQPIKTLKDRNKLDDPSFLVRK